MLHFENVQKEYGNFLALDIPTLTISKGICWLKGENGSGKTTLLKMVAGLHPFKGDILLNGLSIKKQRQAYLSQVSYAEAEPLYPSFITAEDLIKLYCQTKKSSIEAARDMLRQFNIHDDYKKPLGAYSSGMLKKLSLVLAFTGSPQLVLLDEPFITIDAEALETTCGIIMQHAAKGGSFIITSHQPVNSGQISFTNILVAENRTISSLSI
ncbi:ABC transporter ATP-binding protein [Foetidibacter luteolus]|uniref:ABC transporter ATP-binding protein n=1 Tax=Foetidibacter luteolus TaxID=2608880 RepID=UPI00129A1BF8|nr:ABC transporter ATP-binding protein [Foetidibacter luteolus]